MKTINIYIGDVYSDQDFRKLKLVSRMDHNMKNEVNFDAAVRTWMSFIPEGYSLVDISDAEDVFKCTMKVENNKNEKINIIINWVSDRNHDSNNSGQAIDDSFYSDYIESLFGFSSKLEKLLKEEPNKCAK